MILKLHIKNFQAHRDTTMEFDPGVNIIIGKTDSGKTAILRAMRWLVWNRPSGEAFRSSWGGDTEVTVTTTDEQTVTRAKNKENLYELNGKRFTAFNQDVPEEVQNALNIRETNSQKQFDQPFLLTATAGEVAVHFNKIAHIDKIDTSLKKVQSAIRNIEHDFALGEKQIAQYELDLTQYAGLEKMEIELEVLETMEKDLDQLLIASTKFDKLMVQINYVNIDIETESEWLEMEPDVDAILASINTLETVYEKELDALILITDRITSISKTVDENNKVVALEPYIQPILDLYDKRTDKDKTRTELVTALTVIKSTEQTQSQLEKQIGVQQIQFDKEMGEVCILCDQPINTHTHEKEK